MKGIYVTYPVHNMKDQRGIRRKINSQIKVFNSGDLECQEVRLRASKFNIPYLVLKKLQWIPGINIWPRWEYSKIFENIDFIYMRRPSCVSRQMITTLKKIKDKNTSCIIFYEIPTYPYDLEMKGIKKLLLWKDKFNRKKLKECVDFVTLPSLDDATKQIFGIPVINFYNGCDFSKIIPKKWCGHSGEIHLICVANFQPSHGYERLIRGLAKYKQTNNHYGVYIHMVGEGKEGERYKELTKKLNLDKEIIYYGFKSGEELDAIYDIADIAVSALGTYKIGNLKVSCIKNGEYMAKGIPVLGTEEQITLPEACRKYYYSISNDESDVDIESVIKFYENLIQTQRMEELITQIRDNGKLHYDMENSMKAILKQMDQNNMRK